MRPVNTLGVALVAVSTLVMTLLPVSSAHAANVKRQNLTKLISQSERIIAGTVESVSDGIDANGLPYTEITIDVAQSVKGQAGEVYTFRQFGLIKPRGTGDGRVNLMVTPAGWPTYVQGEQVMLFLYKPASRTGLQTTAGLNQGKFTLSNGRIANALANDALFDGVAINTPLTSQQQALVNQDAGAYDADAFFSLVRQAVEQQWIENGVMTDEN